MTRVYLKVSTALGKERAVRDALRRIPGVKSADLVTGEEDIIAVLEGKDLEDVTQVILKKVRGIRGVVHTTTHVVVE